MLPTVIEKKFNASAEQFKNYCKYNIGNLQRLKMDFILLQKEIDIYRQLETVLFANETIKDKSDLFNYQKIDSITMKIQNFSSQKNQIEEYIDRIDYRIKALSMNYTNDEKNSIFSSLNNSILNKNFISFENILITTPIDLNSESNFIINSICFSNYQLQYLEKLLYYGANVNIQNHNGNSLLYEAVSKQNIELVEYLINNNADIGIKTVNGVTPLHKAAFRNNQ